MIQLTRDRTSIPAAFTGADRVALEQELIDRHAAGTKPRSSVWKKAKDQLKAETHGKCAYCEADTAVVAHGDVEHFRPKSVYWWLAYCYDNYTFSCQICNQTFKGSLFPLRGPVMPAPNPEVAGGLAPDPAIPADCRDFARAAKAEKAGIPDPYLVDPERLFVWFCDDTLEEVEIRKRPRARGGARALEAVEETLGLNREELRQLRYAVYKEARTLARIAALPPGAIDAGLQTEAEDLLREKMSARSHFAGMVRYAVTEERGLALAPAP